MTKKEFLKLAQLGCDTEAEKIEAINNALKIWEQTKKDMKESRRIAKENNK